MFCKSAKHLCAVGLLFLLGGPFSVGGKEIALTVVHTNDMHSHLLGYAPNIEFSPESTGDDDTFGGWARLATVISEVRESRSNPVLVCDSGDFLMGSLFHLLCREEAYELRLLDALGYDIIALGNHEFDLKPQGLARILRSASRSGQCPPIVLSNMVFSEESGEDDDLEELFHRGIIEPYRIIEKGGLRIGIFGLLGTGAAEVAPFASPVSFANPLGTARKMVGVLRENGRADIVICLSHSGLGEKKKNSEDEILAKKVDGIDIIISGHTHTLLEFPLVVNDTLIVQTGENGKNVGVLDVLLKNGVVLLEKYECIEVDDRIPGDKAVSSFIRSMESEINARILSDLGMSFRKVVAHLDFDIFIEEDESPLGNLVADSIRWAIDSVDSDKSDPSSRVAVGVMSNGLIRDPLVAGKTGDLAVCDVFRALPLGIGLDDTLGFPLISVYLYASEIKKALEVLTSIYPIKGSDFFLQISGIKFIYNPHRMIFDRVADIWIKDETGRYSPLDYSRKNKTLYRIGTDFYNASFLKFVGDFTIQILKITPKDRNGQPIEDLKTALVDADKKTPGVQELKEWRALIDYIRSFPDRDGDGLPEIPDRYREKQGRIVAEKSWNPFKLLRRGTCVTWIPVSVLVILLAALFFLVRFIRKKV
ncbi:MAG: bifunctional UDP-sugar hydrolase/5'-nucleotidase [Candidatus Aminicenantes bacterium]